MRVLHIDLETYSETSLTDCGVYAYAADPSFEIMLAAFAFDDEPARVIDVYRLNHDTSLEDYFKAKPGVGDDADPELWELLRFALTEPSVLKVAHNANFERTCLAAALGCELPPEQWFCTMVQAARNGLPASLAALGPALGLKEEDQKLTTGKALIRTFCLPCAPTARKGQRTRTLPHHEPGKWDLFKQYCAQDVETERRCHQLMPHSTTDTECRLWCLDQRINDCGVLVDRPFVQAAASCDQTYRARLEEEALQLTGLDNPKSVSQLKAWLEKEEGIAVESLNKQTVPELIKAAANGNTQRVLEIRQELAKTSTTKYEAMLRSAGTDGRLRGLFQYYGAATGRWAGRLVQVQNLPKNTVPDLDLARELVRAGEFELLEMLFGPPPFILSQLIRTALIPAPECLFSVADFSAIEARVIAWLADEKWRLDVFRTHGKIYEASAAAMFNVPIESIGKGSPLRQKGKVAELALGYQGGPGALIQMGALSMGVPEEDLPGLVRAWRRANPKITRLWQTVEDAARQAITERPVRIQHGIDFRMDPAGALHISLPSGRDLVYQRATTHAEGKLAYHGTDSTKRTWGRIDTYGGKLVENIVQAIARDCLAESMLRLEVEGFRTVMHVHDEVIIEVPASDPKLDDILRIMRIPPPWAPDLPLNADGYVCSYYRKD